MSRKPADEDFLGRWSKRKAEARREPEPDLAPDPVSEATDAPEGAEASPKTDAEILEELGLPDPETLGPGSDFSAFMKAAVPDRLRRLALRKLWGTNPVLANLDGMIDYGEDYTDAATVVANLQSAFQAGKGYADKFAAEERARAAAEAEAAQSAGDEESLDADHESVADASDAPEQVANVPDEVAGDATDPGHGHKEPPVREESAVLPRRRMSFRFDEV